MGIILPNDFSARGIFQSVVDGRGGQSAFQLTYGAGNIGSQLGSWFSSTTAEVEENNLLSSEDPLTWTPLNAAVAYDETEQAWAITATAVTGVHSLKPPHAGVPANGANFHMQVDLKAGAETTAVIGVQNVSYFAGWTVNLTTGVLSLYADGYEHSGAYSENLGGGWWRVHAFFRKTSSTFRNFHIHPKTGTSYLPSSTYPGIYFRNYSLSSITAVGATAPNGDVWTAGDILTQPTIRSFPGGRAYGMGGADAESAVYLTLDKELELSNGMTVSWCTTARLADLATASETTDCVIWRGSSGSDYMEIFQRNSSGYPRWGIRTVISGATAEDILLVGCVSYATAAIACTISDSGEVSWFVDGEQVQIGTVQHLGAVTLQKLGMLGGGGSVSTRTNWDAFTHDLRVFSGEISRQQIIAVHADQLIRSGIPLGPWQVYILWGQSNCVSVFHAKDALSALNPIPADMSARAYRYLSPDATYIKTNRVWQLKHTVTDSLFSMSPYGYDPYFGVENGIAQMQTNKKILYVNIGANGCPLNPAINPLYNWAPGGSVYSAQISYLRDILLRISGKWAISKAAVVHGEADSQDATTVAAYPELLSAFWEYFCTDLAVPEFPVVISTLSPSTQTAAGGDVAGMRLAQIAWGSSHGGYFDTDGLPVNADNVHFTTASRMLIGRGLGTL